MSGEATISMAEFLTWEETARRETEEAIAAFEAFGEIESANRARLTLVLIDRAIVAAKGGWADD